MRITGLGHAGMFIETTGGSILCDPVIGPSFFGSWFPFPDNRGLDWERLCRDNLPFPLMNEPTISGCANCQSAYFFISFNSKTM